MKNAFKDFQAMTVFAFAAFLFFLSLSPNTSTVFFIIAIICWITNKNYKDSFHSFRIHKTWWFFIAFYIMHVAGLLWTSNFKYAFFDLQIKLPFLICPLVMAGFRFGDAAWKTFRKAFIFGTSVAGIICFIYAAWNYSTSGKIEFFFYGPFSIFMHPSYFMAYLNLSMLFILYQLFWDREKKQSMRMLYTGLLFFQLLLLFLLSGRTALAAAVITVAIFCIVMGSKKMLERTDLLFLFLFFSVGVLFQVAVLKFNNRYDQITNLIKEPGTKEENSASIRYNIWQIAVDLISEHPVIGVGTGDLKEELAKKYEEYHYAYGIRTHISPHNQFLHTAVILGMLGVLSLVFMLGSAFVLAWKNGDWIYFLFIILVLVNCMTESILERQAGILFFGFVNSLFASKYIATEKKPAGAL